MDGSPGLLALALPVVRGFAGTRLESQLLASAYDWLLPAKRHLRDLAQSVDDELTTASRTGSGAVDRRELRASGKEREI